MEAASLAFSVAQTLLSALQLPELKEIICIRGYESKLKKLEGTVTRINAVLQDAEAQEERSLTRQQLDYVGKLKDAVYDADDLLDEFVTRKQLLQIPDSSKGLVSRLVSLLKKLSLACKKSQEIKKIREKLDGIASDAAQFGFQCDYKEPIRQGSRQSCSYVNPEAVIGREDDKIKIVDVGRALRLRPDGHGGHLSGGDPSFPSLYKERLGRPIRCDIRRLSLLYFSH